MTMTLQQLADRMEINDLLVAYCTAVDRRDWARYETLFTADAIIDYTQAGGIRGGVTEVRDWLAGVMPSFPCYQHLIANSEITLDGDTAVGRTMLFNPMGLQTEAAPHIAFVGLWYNDKLVRTSDGWKFSERIEEVSWMHNWPETFAVPDAS